MSSTDAPKGLLGLPLDLVRIIFELVYADPRKKSFSALRLVCRACRRESEVLLYRWITLSDMTEQGEHFAKTILERLQNADDVLNQYVRGLTFGPFRSRRDKRGCGYFGTVVLRYGSGGGTSGDDRDASRPFALFLDGVEGRVYEKLKATPARKLSIEAIGIPELTSAFHADNHVSPILERAFRNLTDLRSISWRSHFPFPRDALRTLHQTSPTTAITLALPPHPYLPLDLALLSSPQLHAATLTIRHIEAPLIIRHLEGTPTILHLEAPNRDTLSEFSAVKHALAAGNSLKRLTLSVAAPTALPPKHARRRTKSGLHALAFVALNAPRLARGPLNFAFDDDNDASSFLSLEHLRFGLHPGSASRYDFSPAHSAALPRRINCSTLRVLDLADAAPAHLLAALTGHVPQLTSLALGVRRARFPTHELASEATLDAFLGSIAALDDVTVRGGLADLSGVRRLLAKHHGGSVRRLGVLIGWAGYGDAPGVRSGPGAWVLQLLRPFTALERASVWIGSVRYEVGSGGEEEDDG